MKNTLIIPCAGKSSRFPNMKPKWMLTHPNGKLMVQEALSGLDLSSFDRIIITIVKEHSEKYEAKLILSQIFDLSKKSKFEVLELDHFTSSQSHTVYETLKKKKIIGNFVVKDSDNFVHVSKSESPNFVVGLDINKFPGEVFRLKSKSFITKNDQNIITNIVEKKIVSENICLGVYGFDDPKKFMKAFEILSKKNSENEIYLSHIISYLIGTEEVIYSYTETNDFEDWGTMEDWRNTQIKHSTYFVDIDGILLENRGKFGKKNWSNTMNPIKENIECIKKLYEKGAQIVLTTCRSKKEIAPVKEMLENEGIQIHSIVTECNHSPRVLINDFAPTNPYPSCKAVNVPRNHSISSYIEK